MVVAAVVYFRVAGPPTSQVDSETDVLRKLIS